MRRPSSAIVTGRRLQLLQESPVDQVEQLVFVGAIEDLLCFPGVKAETASPESGEIACETTISAWSTLPLSRRLGARASPRERPGGVLRRQCRLPLPGAGFRGPALRARRSARRRLAADRGRRRVFALWRRPWRALVALDGGRRTVVAMGVVLALMNVLLRCDRPATARHGGGDRVPAGDRAGGGRHAHGSERACAGDGGRRGLPAHRRPHRRGRSASPSPSPTRRCSRSTSFSPIGSPGTAG